MTRFLLLVAFVVLPCTAVSHAAPEPPPTDGEIQGAVERACAWLEKRQLKDGSWGAIHGRGRYGASAASSWCPTGPTSLALYALLSAGYDEKRPAVKKALAFLEEKDRPKTAVELSMLALALSATARTKSVDHKLHDVFVLAGRRRLWFTRVVSRLLDHRIRNAWGYKQETGVTPLRNQDLFTTHLAACALLASYRVGGRMTAPGWEPVLVFALAQQEGSGTPREVPDVFAEGKTRAATTRGFAYRTLQTDFSNTHVTGGRTACGLTTLAICRSVLGRWGLKYLKDPKSIWAQRSDAKAVDQAIHDGLAWLIAHWSAYANPQAHGRFRVLVEDNDVCWLWNLQTAMDALGVDTLGTVRWFDEVARQLMERQAKAGHWKGNGSFAPDDVLSTCFAVLVLTRATRRVVQPR